MRHRIPRQAEVGDGRRRRTGRQRVAQHLDELVDRLEAGKAAVATQRLEDRGDLRAQVEDVAEGAIDKRDPEIPHELRHDALELHEIGGEAARVDVAELCKVERAARGGPERGWHELEGRQLGDRVEEIAGGHTELQCCIGLVEASDAERERDRHADAAAHGGLRRDERARWLGEKPAQRHSRRGERDVGGDVELDVDIGRPEPHGAE